MFFFAFFLVSTRKYQLSRVRRTQNHITFKVFLNYLMHYITFVKVLSLLLNVFIVSKILLNYVRLDVSPNRTIVLPSRIAANDLREIWQFRVKYLFSDGCFLINFWFYIWINTSTAVALYNMRFLYFSFYILWKPF